MATPETPEKMLPQSQVNKIVAAARRAARNEPSEALICTLVALSERVDALEHNAARLEARLQELEARG